MVIRRVSPMSAAKIGGLLYAFIGLLIGAVMSLAFGAIGSLAGDSDLPHAPLMGMMMGAGAIVVAPIFYGVLGFVTSAVTAMIYNLLAGWIGGIEIEVDTLPAA